MRIFNDEQIMKTFLYFFVQCTWGILQSTLGIFNFIFHIRNRHYFYHGAVVTEWKNKASISLGMFVFVTKEPRFSQKLKNKYTMAELSNRLLVHEYGHTIQSLMLGPLYLIIIGIPSTLWGILPYYIKKRKTSNLSYFSFFTEKWANILGEWATGQKSLEKLL